MDLKLTNISSQLKILANYRGYTMKSLGEEFNKRFNTKYTQPGFSRKINNPKIGFDELLQLSEILHFDIEIKPN